MLSWVEGGSSYDESVGASVGIHSSAPTELGEHSGGQRIEGFGHHA